MYVCCFSLYFYYYYVFAINVLSQNMNSCIILPGNPGLFELVFPDGINICWQNIKSDINKCILNEFYKHLQNLFFFFFNFAVGCCRESLFLSNGIRTITFSSCVAMSLIPDF